MTESPHILCAVGTRPEAVKMAPVIRALKADPDVRCTVLATAQHRELLDQVLGLFEIVPDIDLDAMEPGQTLPGLTAKLVRRLDEVLGETAPDAVLAQGDTTTVMVTALASFYRRIPFGHVEAGLRTHDMFNPFPEEANRVIAGHLARWHFAPTDSTRENLLREGIPGEQIAVTGNTVIDALLDVAGRDDLPAPDIPEGRRLMLVTAHRRENFGAPFERICAAIREIADAHPDLHVLYPVHPNPNIRDVVESLLGDHPRIELGPPLDYLPFVGAMKAAHLIVSDSGGVQEEAPALGVPVLVLRAETERPEAIAHGSVKLVGTDTRTIVAEASRLLSDPDAHAAMSVGTSPYGDGLAAGRIVARLKRDLAGS